MRDTKSLLLLLVSLLLVIVSFILIWTWGYNYYSNSNGTTQRPVTADSVSISNKIRDSLQTVYTATLHDLDKQFDSTLIYSDSLKEQLDVKLAEFYRLKNEISEILKSRNADNTFKVAKQKINELQIRAENLKAKNQVVDTENKRLSNVLTEISNPEKNIKPAAVIKNQSEEKESPVYSAFTASDAKLSAVSVSGETEIETSVAEQANKLNGSITVKNFNSQLTNAEMMVIVLTPDGRVLKNSSWDNGTFNTPDGKKVYSHKFNFSYSRGDARRLEFSIKTKGLVKGNYSMEVYHNGVLIGKTVKTLQ